MATSFLYEVGFGAETGWKALKGWEKGMDEIDPPPFDYVAELLDAKIALICERAGATQPPTVYISGKGNFREQIAKKKGYKENRADSVKPFHYPNIKSYLQTKYECIIVEGMEADDAICIEQTRVLKELGPVPFKCTNEQLSKYTVICTRDKDLRQCPGWHYGWELGNQPEFGPEFVSGFGYIKLSKDCKKLSGVGEKFFYAQLLMGDPTDNIPGVPKLGPKKAFDMLVDTQTRVEARDAVIDAYRGFYGDSWEEEMIEQGQLLYMVRELDEEGKPVMWRMDDVAV